jgi:hypothetical protein
MIVSAKIINGIWFLDKQRTKDYKDKNKMLNTFKTGKK